MSRARSAHEIIGLPPLGGLPLLAAEDAKAVPYAKERQLLVQQFQKAGGHNMPPGTGTYTKAAWEGYIKALSDAAAPENAKVFAAELEKAKRAIAETDPKNHAWIEPNLDTPENQLLWAATLLHLYSENQLGGDFTQSALVRQVQHSRYLDTILMEFGANMADLGVNAKVILGPPGSWFYNVHGAHIVNLDLFHLLTVGGFYDPQLRRGTGHFEALAMHEFGHEQSRVYPPEIQKLWERMEALKEKEEKEQGLDIAEIKEYLLLRKEWDLRHGLWNASEDNFVNRYADNHRRRGPGEQDIGGTYPVHLGDSLNVATTIVNGVGEMISAPPASLSANPSVAQKYANLRRAANMVFFVDNHLVPDTKEGWEALGIHPEWIENFKQKGFSTHQSLDRLKELARGIQDACPLPGDASFRQFETEGDKIINGYDAWVSHHNEQRNVLIGQIFEEYANPLIAEMLQNRKQQLQQLKIQMQGMGTGTGTGQGNGEGQGEGDGDGQGNVVVIKFRVKGTGGTANVPDVPPATPAEAKTKEVQKKHGGKSPGEIDQEHAGAPTTAGLRDRKLNGSSPDRGQGGEGKGKDKDKGGKDGKDGTRANTGPNTSLGQPGLGAGNEESPFAELELGDGRSYAELIKDPAYEHVVGQIAWWDNRLQDKVRHYESRRNPQQLDYAPLGGDFRRRRDRNATRRFDRAAVEGKLTPEHFRTYQSDRPVAIPTDLVRYLLVDGSGSMTGDKQRIEIAMKASAALDAGTSRNGQPCYVDMWGDSEPWKVVAPGMTQEQKILAIDGILNGKNCGTQLAPAIYAISERLAKEPLDHQKPYGLVHIVILSDGDIFDAPAAKIALTELLDKVPNAVVDALIVREPNGELVHLLNEIEPLRSYQKPGVFTARNWQEAPHRLIEMLEARAHQAGKINTITPDVLKRQLGRVSEHNPQR